MDRVYIITPSMRCFVKMLRFLDVLLNFDVVVFIDVWFLSLSCMYTTSK